MLSTYILLFLTFEDPPAVSPEAATVVAGGNVAADLTLRRGAEAHFQSRNDCDLTTVDVSVVEQANKLIPGTTTTLKRATVTVRRTPIALGGSCTGIAINAQGSTTNPNFTMDSTLGHARVSGSITLFDASAGNAALPATFDLTWGGVGPLAPSVTFERQDLGDSIAYVWFAGIQRPARATGTVIFTPNGVNHAPTPSGDSRMFRDLNATATIRKK